MVSIGPILFIHSGYRSFNYTLFKKLANLDLNLHFLFIQDEKYNLHKIPTELRKEMNYESLNLTDKKILRSPMGPGLGMKGAVALFIKLTRIIVKGNHKIIITATEHPLHSKIAFVWAKLRRCRIIIWTESWYANSNENFLMRIYHLMSQFVLRKADAVLVRGTAQLNYCEKLGISEHRIFLFNRCSEDLARYKIKQNIRRRLGINHMKIVLFMGRIVQLKGLDVLINAFSKIERNYDDVFLLICGDGNFRSQCENLSGKLRIKNIHFEGMIDSAIVYEYFAASDIFVLPSKNLSGQMEGWGSVLNEAASMGKPIITTDAVGGAFDIVKNGSNGYVVKNGSVDELYGAIDKIRSDDRLRMRMGKKSREIFKEFNDYDKAVNNLKKAVEYVRLK